MTELDHLAALRGEVVAFTGALRGANLDAPVASCPGWTVRDLAGHLTGVHRWATLALDDAGPPAYDETPDDDPVAAYASAAQSLLDRLAELPADAPAWTFDKTNRTAGFWRRRQLHEVWVHRWDLEQFEGFHVALAVDGIEEVVDFFLPRQIALGRTELPAGSLRLVTPQREWRVGDGPETVVAGAAGELLLRLWGRGEPLPGPWTDVALTP